MLRYINLILLWAIAVAGCSGHLLSPPPAPSVIETERFVIVPAGSEDTMASLAIKYLGDADKAWQIAAYNRIDVLTPGQRVVIPRVPLVHGGIEQNGYHTIPILLYPKLTRSSSKSKAVNANNFDRQLQYLSNNGFVTISLDQLYAFVNLQDQLPPKAVVISFDTTQRWVYDVAFPYLKRYNMKAALFVRQNQIGAKGMLTWQQVAEMAANGLDIGVHGLSVKPSEEEDLKQYFQKFEKEFTAPKKAFRTHLKKPCTYFAYPRIESNDLTIAMLKKHGYRMAFTRKRGSNPFFINNYKFKRSLIHGHYDMERFRRNLTTFKSAELK